MVTVALAGVSTGLGRTVLNAFIHLNAQHDGQHTIVALSRAPLPFFSDKGVQVRVVDYANHANLVAALQDVHTVLPFTGGDPSAMVTVQLALLAAAKEAGYKRFAPSEYAFQGYAGIDLFQGKAKVFEAVGASGLEYTRFNCGLFMSVLATGTPKPLTEVGRREGCATGEEEALAGLRMWNYVVHMLNGTADLPGDGTAKMVLTDVRDVGAFVYHALSLPSWPRDLGMRGDVKSFAELVAIAERVQGRKWLTKTTSVEALKEKAEDWGATFYNQTRLAMVDGAAMVGNELNEAFPEVKPVDAEAFVEKWWAGVELGEASWGSMHNPM